MEIAFRLNGEDTTAHVGDPTETLLDWLRARGLTGTKEGCNEGDCGACSVVVTDRDGLPRALNACILFMPQLAGRAVRTVEGLTAPDGTLHPVQAAMVEHHGSQCGFCTPGFVTTMAAAHARGDTDHEDQLAGNLCRCTGYAPILRAARAAEGAPVPDQMREASLHLARHIPGERPTGATPSARRQGATPSARRQGATAEPFMPRTADDLAAWYLDHPDATLIAGATDVGLWVTKQFRALGDVAFLAGCDDLRGVEIGEDAIRIGAMTDMETLRHAIAPHHPAFAEVLRRYGSVHVRGAATIGGNVANGSPIGDSPPPLIALGAMLHLRRGDERRSMPLEEFFLEYGRQDRAPGEFVEAVSIPRQSDALACRKVSKRFDQDISALCMGANLPVVDGRLTGVRIAFGGMAGTPARARATEAALEGVAPTDAAFAAAAERLADDFTPLTDMRASAGYRLAAARGALMGAWHARWGGAPDLLELSA
jgi:xanthine dehydrogenase small subunit